MLTGITTHEGGLATLDVEAGSSPLEPVASDSQQFARVMIVDDDVETIHIVQNHLYEGGYRRFLASTDAVDAISLALENVPDVMLLDLTVAEISGLEILHELRRQPATSRLPVIVLTPAGDLELKRAALECGATDFLYRPVDPTDLVLRVRNVLAVKAYQDHLKNYAMELEQEVRERTAEVVASRLEVIYCLGRAAEYRDNETGRHVIRVGRCVGILARALGLDEATVTLFEQAAPLHDMGKIGIPDAILLKPGRLDEEEMEIMRKHTEYGASIVSNLQSDEWSEYAKLASTDLEVLRPTQSPVLRVAASIAMTHHERWDGNGYPRGLRGEAIPIEGRITAVADVFDALSSKRPYKPALPLEECFRIIEEGRGTQFDPQVVDAFFAHRDEIVSVSVSLADDEGCFRNYRQGG